MLKNHRAIRKQPDLPSNARRCHGNFRFATVATDRHKPDAPRWHELRRRGNIDIQMQSRGQVELVGEFHLATSKGFPNDAYPEDETIDVPGGAVIACMGSSQRVYIPHRSSPIRISPKPNDRVAISTPMTETGANHQKYRF